ncbi:MAG: hypothetical protein ACKO8I_15280 [Cyanobacteriota bacterium]
MITAFAEVSSSLFSRFFPMAASPDLLASDARQALQRAGLLFAAQGTAFLRAQAQQQAALELLQARRFGASDGQLEAILLGEIRESLARMLRHSAPLNGPRFFPPRPAQVEAMEQRVAIFLQAEAEQWILGAQGLNAVS